MTMFLLFVFPFACPILSVSSLFGVCCMLYVVSCRTVSCSVVLFYGLGVLVDADVVVVVVVVIVTTIVVVLVVAALCCCCCCCCYCVVCNTLLIMVVWHYYCYCSGAVVNVVYDLRCDKMRAVNDVDHHCVLLFFVFFFFFFDTHRDAPPLPATAGVTSGCYADFGRVLTTRLAEFKQLPRRVTNLLPDFEV